jgi:hypothetical protein
LKESEAKQPAAPDDEYDEVNKREPSQSLWARHLKTYEKYLFTLPNFLSSFAMFLNALKIALGPAILSLSLTPRSLPGMYLASSSRSILISQRGEFRQQPHGGRQNEQRNHRERRCGSRHTEGL